MNIENLDDEFFYKSLNNKRIIIEKQLDLQEQKKKMLFEYCDTIMNVISIAKNVDNNWDDILTELKETMEILAINIQALKKMRNEIDEINKLAKNIKDSNDSVEIKEIKIDDLEHKLKEYNEEEKEEYPKLLDKTKENEDLINKIIKNANDILAKENEIKEKNQNDRTEYNSQVTFENQENIKNKNTKEKSNKQNNNKQEKKIENENISKFITNENSGDSKTLIVSEMEGKVYLPYYMEDIKKLMKKNSGKCMEDIIREYYVVPISRFKNTITARFKEAYNLLRKKGKGSIVEAIELGMELMLNYSLHPAVIAACRNVDELDIYLDCLEENELDQFEIFDIKYETAPVVVKNRKNKHSWE